MINMKNQTPEYEYFLKDHPGNTRVVLNTEAQFVEQHDYYPFGMEFAGRQGGDIKYRYNGKEMQDMKIGGRGLDWYDYGFRFYDPALGRFPSLDPKADEFENLSPYNYASNNPVTCIDLWGIQGRPVNKVRDQKGNITAATTSAQQSTYISTMEPKTISNNSIEFKPTNESIYQSANWWELTTAPDIQEWLKVDKVPSAVAVGGLITVLSAAVPEVISGITDFGSNVTLNISTSIESSTTIAVGTGVVVGAAKTLTDAPPDTPEIPNPVIEVSSEMTEYIIQSTHEFMKNIQNSNDKKSK